MNKKMHRNQGQMALALLISTVLMTSGVLLWQYQAQLYSKTPGAKINAEARAIAETVLTRAKVLLVRQTKYLTSAADTSGADCVDLSDFRNLSIESPSWSLNAGTSAESSLWWVNCLLSLNEAALLSSDQTKMSIKISALGKPSVPDIKRTVRVEVIVKPRTVTGALTSEQKIVRNYTIRVALPTDFGVILVPGVGVPQINPLNGNKIQFVGAILQASSLGSTSFNLTNTVSMTAGLVAFNNTFFARPHRLNDVVAAGPDLSLTSYFSDVFNRGVETSVLNFKEFNGSGTDTFKLVLPSDYVGDATMQAAWKMPLDYYSPDILFPLPAPPVGATSSQFYTGPEYSATPANNNAFPYKAGDAVNGVNSGIYHLADTCRAEPPSTGNIGSDPATKGKGRTFVFSKPDEDLILDFSKNPFDAGVPANVFCGLVIAKSTKIITGDDASIGMFGTFITSQIIIDSPVGTITPKTVYFFNPKEGKPLPSGIMLPDSRSQTQVHDQFFFRSSNLTSNFYVPLAQRIGNDMGDALKPFYWPKRAFLFNSPFMRSYCDAPMSPPPDVVETDYCWSVNGSPSKDYNLLFGGPNGTPVQYNNIGWFVEETL